MKRLVLVLLLLAVAGVVVWGVLRKGAPPRVAFTRVQRTTLVGTLPTNGKVEPFEWQAVRSQAGGVVSRLAVHEGQTVARGAVLAEMTDPALQPEVNAAEARVSEARANLAALEAGGKPAELVEIENNLAQARFELQQEQNEYASLRRLAEHQAATAVEVRTAKDKIDQTQLQIEGLEKRRVSLVAKTDLAAARARIQDAEAALELARQRFALSAIRAPIAGEVYGLAVRAGDYLKPGDLVGNIGRLDRMRVRVYVDEPELGRVAEGQPVNIVWQALSGKEWHGTVERKPTSIESLGSRQVGQVVCIVDNPGRELIPGTNVDASIRTSVVENAVVVPKEALRHDSQGDFVFRLAGDALERRDVKTGHASITHVEISTGLAPGDAVALPSDVALVPGLKVTPTGI